MTEEERSRKRKTFPELYDPPRKEQCIASCKSGSDLVLSFNLRLLCPDVQRVILDFVGIFGACFSCGFTSYCTRRRDYSLCGCLKCKIGKDAERELDDIAKVGLFEDHKRRVLIDEFIDGLGKSPLRKPLFCEQCLPGLEEQNNQIKCSIEDSVNDFWDNGEWVGFGTDTWDDKTMLIHVDERIEKRREFLSWRQIYALECLSDKVNWIFCHSSHVSQYDWTNGPPLHFEARLVRENRQLDYCKGSDSSSGFRYHTGCSLFSWDWL